MSKNNQMIVKAATYLNDYYPQIIMLLGTIILGASGVWSTVEKEKLDWVKSGAGITFCFSSVATAYGTIQSWKQTRRTSSLEEEKGELKDEVARLEDVISEARKTGISIIEMQLEEVSTQLNFGNSERVSIYKHHDNNFIMLGRYSKSPIYNEPGRSIYGKGAGCIGQAFNEGESYLKDLPNPEIDPEGYENVLKKDWKIDKSITKKFTMKSRSLVAYAVESSVSPKKTIGVVVFESTEPDKLDKDEIKKLLGQPRYGLVCQLIESFKSFNPSPIKATEEGY